MVQQIIKNLFLSFLFTIFSIGGFAQVGIGTETPDPSSIIDIVSTEKGVLLPQMTEAVRTGMVLNPASEGLLVYQTDADEGFWYYDGIAWTKLTGGSASGHWDANADDIHNNNTGHVGIGTGANVDTPFHIKGITQPSSTVVTEIFAEDYEGTSEDINFISGDDHGCTSDVYDWYWETTLFGTYIDNHHATIWFNTDNCVQDQTLIEGPFIPNTSSINVEFGYYFNSFGDGTDEFSVYLHNDDDSSIISLIGPIYSDADALYNQTINGLDPNASYTLRFHYKGQYDFGAEVDNILITSTATTSGSYTFRLEDGTQAPNYVLTSDADGNGYWAPYPTAAPLTAPLQGNGNNTAIEKNSSIQAKNSHSLDVNKASINLATKWLHHHGTGKLVNGLARIELDKEYSKSIIVNDENPLLVFIQEQGNTKGLYVIPDEDGSGFTVKEKNGGNSNIEFSYTVTAERSIPQKAVSINSEHSEVGNLNYKKAKLIPNN